MLLDFSSPKTIYSVMMNILLEYKIMERIFLCIKLKFNYLKSATEHSDLVIQCLTRKYTSLKMLVTLSAMFEP